MKTAKAQTNEAPKTGPSPGEQKPRLLLAGRDEPVRALAASAAGDFQPIRRAQSTFSQFDTIPG
jgi:hypothetical protein